MKKFILIFAIALVGFTVKAQEFNLGLSAALPSGDAGDFYTFSLVLDAEYLYEISEQFKVGGTTGYIYSFGDEIGGTVEGFDVSAEVDDSGFIPLAASGRFMASEDLTFGADVGYAIGVQPSDVESGFYYALKALYGVSENLDIVAAYRAISVDNGIGGNVNLGYISLGVMLGL